jgi:chromosome segregation ATPase
MMKALLLESQLVENQIASSKLERAHDLELKQLRAQLAEAATRIGELENFEKEYRATAALVETLTRDLHELKVEKEGWQKETQEKLDAKEKEIMDLEKRTSEAAEEKQVLEQGNAVVVQRLTAENLRLTHRLEEREQAFTKEKTELTKRVHEVEAIAAELQWSEGSEHGLQRVLQEVTRESDAFKRQIHELEARVLSQQQDRGQHELEMSRLQRQLVEARRESTGISTLSLDTRPAPRLASRIPEIQSDPPPPAYDDAVFV